MLGSDSRLYVPATALATTTKVGSINKLSGNTTDFLDGTNTFQNLASAPAITLMRLRSFNAIGNPTFEIDQRNVGQAIANPAGGTFIMDRWLKGGSGTYQVSCVRSASGAGLVLPGTNFRISAGLFSTTLTTAQATLAAGDFLAIRQTPEGIVLRELIGDVHSIQVLVNSSVAPLKFSVFLRDVSSTRSLVKLCTYTTQNVWQLITLPNLPVWDAGGTFNITPGLQGYDFGVTLACGSTFIAPAADIWQNGNFLGAAGMDSFVSKAVNSTFFIGFLQHEPGSQCTTPIDKPFTQNYDDCLRYFCKSYSYATRPGTVTSIGAIRGYLPAASQPIMYVPFKRPMALAPTITMYSSATGAAGNVRDLTAGADKAVSTVVDTGEMSFAGATVTDPNAAIWQAEFNYAADTGW